ncbi:MAG TPA: class I SAM-dependent methyltransferase [Micromonosporaceae bacterium]
MTDRDWVAWHEQYDEPGSPLARRLDVVRHWIRVTLDKSPPGPLSVVSMVAGQGRDLIPVLAAHRRRLDVTACLVELDQRNAAVARRTAEGAGLDNLHVVTGDAADLDHYAKYAPADLVMMCGLFGNVTDDDIKRTIGYGLALTKRGGTVIWTRGRQARDLVPMIGSWFLEAGYEEVYVSDPAYGFGVGVHRSTLDPPPLPPGVKAFSFVKR